MSAETLLPPSVPPPAAPARFARVEYLDFRDVAGQREFRLRVCEPEGSTEFRLGIAIADFGAGRLRLQDGPDVCYQRLLRAVAAGETGSGAAITVDDADLASYREAHTQAPKHKSYSAPQPPPPASAPRVRRPRPVEPVAATEPSFGEGQRVSHAAFGLGVTAASSRGHTIVRFDQDGSRTFVTSLLKLEVLSGAHTWETGPRGTNRPRQALLPRD